MDMDRKADLHYAYQFGQDAIRGDFEQVKAEFGTNFAGDAEAQVSFDKGVADEKARQARLN